MCEAAFVQQHHDVRRVTGVKECMHAGMHAQTHSTHHTFPQLHLLTVQPTKGKCMLAAGKSMQSKDARQGGCDGHSSLATEPQ